MSSHAKTTRARYLQLENKFTFLWNYLREDVSNTYARIITG